MKYLGKGILILISLYLLVLGLIYVDVYEKRPLVSLFNLFQSNSSLEIVDYSIKDNKDSDKLISSNQDRNPYYGDLHVHTKHSFDAYIFGVTASPDDAYDWAKGKSMYLNLFLLLTW